MSTSYKIVLNFTIWLSNLPFGCRFYHLVVGFGIWLSILPFSSRFYPLVGKIQTLCSI